MAFDLNQDISVLKSKTLHIATKHSLMVCFCVRFTHRVPANDTIFEGVTSEAEPADIGRYCKCNHVVFRGVQCTCGPGELVETCDMDLSTYFV